MKITIGTIERETIVMEYAMRFDDGLTLRTGGNLGFRGKEQRDATRAQFLAVVDAMRAAGFEIVGTIRPD